MTPVDLPDFLDQIERAHQLATISTAMDPDQEIAAVINQMCKSRDGGQALLFEKVKGVHLPLVANLFGSDHRMQICFGAGTSLDHRVARLKADLAATGRASATQALQDIIERQAPAAVIDAHPLWQEQDVTGAGLDTLPALKSWPGDGGRYLTLAQVHTYHPESRVANAGLYRVQILDSHTALLRCHPGSGGLQNMRAWHAQGKAMPVALVLGGPPIMTWAACTSLPGGISETDFVGYLTGQPFRLSRCTDPNLSVPATAEIVIEGSVPPGEERPEGPFGNHTGRYVPAAPAPVLRIRQIRRRKQAIYPCTVVGPPPMENVYLAKVAAKFLLTLLQHDCPWVQDVHMPAESIFHQVAFVVTATAQGAADVAMTLRQSRLLRNAKLLVLLPPGADAQRVAEVYWRVVNLDNLPQQLITVEGSLVIDARCYVAADGVQADPQVLHRVRQILQRLHRGETK
ncbi:MAG: UbiD family decarboxylase [Desulfuromonadales bacterium]